MKKSMKLPIIPIGLMALGITLVSCLRAQEVYFFRDSNNPGYYDTGLAFKSGASFVEQTGPSGDKIPTSATALQGTNSLRLRWFSRSGGDWSALVIAPGFPFQDIRNTDTLSFWAYAPNGLAQAAWPNLSLEGAPGATKSRKYPLSNYAPALPPQQWTQVKVPLAVFFNDPNQTGINFQQIKAVIFGQQQVDTQEQQLLIDEVKTYRVGVGVVLEAPVALTARGYDSHVELRWRPAPGNSNQGFRIYRALDGSRNFQLVAQVDRGDSLYQDFVRPLGLQVNATYQVRAINGSGQESPPSPEATAQTVPLSDEAFLDMVQAYTFRYFWEFAHPNSGLIRERNTSGDLVTIGGSGFGIHAILIGVERGFITRQQGLERLGKILAFLEKADRFQGAYPHWMNGNTGKTIPFSTRDDGGDLMETAFLLQGLLTARSFFGENNAAEQELRTKITSLWEAVDWNWYRQYFQNFLYWHWSPRFQFAMNFPIRGWNEGLIVYVLAVASPRNGTPENIYHQGWAASSSFSNGRSYFNIPLPLGPPQGGPLFFAHYSFMGLDPRGLEDRYANYFTQNRNHTLINRAYCIANPKGFKGYGENSWGLTASDDPLQGYLAHEPNSGSQDNGTIAPTAALSSMPYTPSESIAALKHFYREYGAKLWGPMGFYDAFNPQLNWYANSYLAIDQGPILNMIENYRSGLSWKHFMANPEIGVALQKMGFRRSTVAIPEITAAAIGLRSFPNPTREYLQVEFTLPEHQIVTIDLTDSVGRTLQRLLEPTRLSSGPFARTFSLPALPAGSYYLKIKAATFTTVQPLVISQ